MKIIVVTILICGFGLLSTQKLVRNYSIDEQNKTLSKKPEFFAMEWQEGVVLKNKPTPFFIEVETMGNQNIDILVTQQNRPVLYTADICTPVCADGECRLMYITLYWNLLGAYAGYDKVEGQTLTKHDHVEFLEQDYEKLHHLLMDDNSILKRKKIDELVLKPKESELDGVDAIAGATIAEVKESVVDGALYSCYVAWNIAHGPIKAELQEYTTSMFDNKLKGYMLMSSEVDYQMYALNSLSESEYLDYKDRIVQIFKLGIPLVRTYIVQNLPKLFWESESLQRPFWESFAEVDINNRSLLLNHIQEAPLEVLVLLASNLEIMTKNQLKLYLSAIENIAMTNPDINAQLLRFAESGNHIYAYIVAEFLEEME
ncbi:MULTISPECIES: hypothetical protein [Arenibacter]|uniref:hypothetical protein n=1 Tax=Arenibacter TaxID=178469 RepID=UPI001C0795FE|nr:MULTISPECIES: hypothetical protein [Arenibacter]MBU2904851.1 hypothetical protein [Arenibacter algicola]MCK0134639.1 hypothetical protein [Arenibacter sp. S6351L]